MNYWYLFWGCLFLFNPSVNLIDFLPDFIGIILILKGMSKIADLNNYVADAYVKMRWSLWVSLGKFAGLLLVGTLDATMILVISFAAGVLECAFLIPAFAGLFDGLDYLAIRESDHAIGDLPKAKTVTALFIILRAVGAFFPGVAAMLYSTANGSVTSGNRLSADMLNLMMNVIFCVLIGAIGILWLTMIYKTVKAFASCRELTEKLVCRYQTEVLDNKDVMIRKNVRMMMLLSFLAIIPLISFKAESHYVVPEFVFGILMFSLTFVSGKYADDRKFRCLNIVLAAVGLVQYVILWIFEDNFGDYTFDTFAEAFEKEYYPLLFALVCVLSLGFYILMILSSCLFCRKTENVVNECVGLKGEYTDLRRMDIDNEKKKKLIRRSRAQAILLIVYAALSMVTLTIGQLYGFREIWILKFVLGLALVLYAYALTRNITDEAENAL